MDWQRPFQVKRCHCPNGAAGSIILILLWVSYSSMILFYGAELTAAYAKMYSGIVPPTKIAKTDIQKTV